MPNRTGLDSERVFRYPVICEGDPFYLLYFLDGKSDDLLWIWLYEIDGFKFDLRWSFDADRRDRKIPALAIENLSKKELWYRVEVVQDSAVRKYRELSVGVREINRA